MLLPLARTLYNIFMPLPPQFLKMAIQLARSGEREQARTLFCKILEQDPDNIKAWLWLSELSNKLEDQIEALEKAASLCSAEGSQCPGLQVLLVEIRGSIPLAVSSFHKNESTQAIIEIPG